MFRGSLVRDPQDPADVIFNPLLNIQWFTCVGLAPGSRVLVQVWLKRTKEMRTLTPVDIADANTLECTPSTLAVHDNASISGLAAGCSTLSLEQTGLYYLHSMD